LGEKYKSFSSSLCNLLLSPVTSSLLGPNILLSNTFSNTLSFLSSLSVSDQVSHPYKTTGKIVVLYILIFKIYRTIILLQTLFKSKNISKKLKLRLKNTTIDKTLTYASETGTLRKRDRKELKFFERKV